MPLLSDHRRPITPPPILKFAIMYCLSSQNKMFSNYYILTKKCSNGTAKTAIILKHNLMSHKNKSGPLLKLLGTSRPWCYNYANKNLPRVILNYKCQLYIKEYWRGKTTPQSPPNFLYPDQLLSPVPLVLYQKVAYLPIVKDLATASLKMSHG